MEHGQVSSRFGLHILNDMLVVPVRGELDDDTVFQLQREILEKTLATSVSGVLIDMSAVQVLDSYVFSILADTARMVMLLGRCPVFVGFQAGVASSLIDLNVDLSHLTTALTIEDALDLLHALKPRWKLDVQPGSEDLDGGGQTEGNSGDEGDSGRSAVGDEGEYDRR